MVDAQIHASTEADPIPDSATGPPRWRGSRSELPRKRALIRLFMDVTLMPPAKRGRVFDADSGAIHWKLPAPGADGEPL